MALYGAETWGLRETERKLDIFEMKSLRSMCGLTLWNRIRNEEVKSRVRVERQLSGRVDQCVVRRFGYVERMDEEHMTKEVMISDAEGNWWNWCRSRPRLGWMDGVRMALGERGVSVEQGRRNALGRR